LTIKTKQLCIPLHLLIQLIMTLPLTNKTKLVNLNKKEKDPKVKERSLLIIRVRHDQQVAFRAIKEMNRSNPWASDWLKRYDKEGIGGIKDKQKSGRHPELPSGIKYKIKTILIESNQDWTTKHRITKGKVIFTYGIQKK
jgi:transposase